MVIGYESQSIFRQGESNSASEYDTTPSEYEFIKSSVDYCLDQGDCNYNVYLDHIIKQKVHP
jgi:hypothetical protein